MMRIFYFVKPFIIFWLVLLFTVVSSGAPLMAQEDPTYTMLAKDQKAPYSGVLLSPEAMAKILADSEYTQKKLQLECEYDKKIESAEKRQEVEQLQVQLKLEEKYSQQIYDLQTRELEKLRNVATQTEPDNKNRYEGLWWGLGGFGVGALLTFGSVWAVSQLNGE